MGRPSTGAWTVYESLRIELSYLIKNKFLIKGSVQSSMLSWTNQHGEKSGNIKIILSYLTRVDEKYIRLIYTCTDGTGNKTEYDYKVFFVEVKSNLGKGNILYFRCPQTSSKCRIIYKAYNSGIFKSRDAYHQRLYYDCQQSSKLSKYNDNFWRLDKHLLKLEKVALRGERTYKGLLTRNAERFNRLTNKQCEMDELRWTLGVPKCLRNEIFKNRNL
jgi:hypothetical protein